MLNIRLSNRFESLLDLLAARAREPLGDVFVPMTIIVPSAAVQRAATLHLAEQLGVCANVGFNYPATWIWRQIAHAPHRNRVRFALQSGCPRVAGVLGAWRRRLRRGAPAPGGLPGTVRRCDAELEARFANEA